MAKTVLVTGASSGIGRATAVHLAQQGYVVYGAARRAEKLQTLQPYGVRPIRLDITDDQSITDCVHRISTEAGHIDILINSAGLGSYGALEDVPIAEAKNQLDINLFGAARLIQLVLPAMRANNYGKVVNISSVGGKIGLPLGSWYHASKFALEGLSDALRNEVKQFGVDVIIIEPGGTQSEMIAFGTKELERVSGHTVYAGYARALTRQYAQMEKNASDPIVIAKLILKSIEAKCPQARYAGGAMAKPMLLMRSLLPDRIFDRVLVSQMK